MTTPPTKIEIKRQKAIEYYNRCKEQITAKRKTMVTCECGRKFQQVHLSKHKKSKPHKEFLEEKELMEAKAKAIYKSIKLHENCLI